MDELNEISRLYKTPPKEVKQNQNIENHHFTDMILQTKVTAKDAFDKLAYLAGIKNAPADDKYSKLNTSNLDSLLESANLLGYDIEIVSV
ncbi:XRE family transcriptional regulator [Proteus sp. DFP240708]|uniref:XRE family transcriptional regulator n=1 Tax=Proteus TaxID=583 RepID=UPI0018E4B909|nr:MULTISPECIES: XRE family transcriptional regulator [Proteus]MBI6216789.1 XRE family transcriptional regulator [Proteus vulgaris]MBI6339638.1 XRE family transcriptional regulator [Proteus sp. PR00224]MBI6406238.1 XRE family transcriptional regulator [Proteus sp. PR00208]MBI6543729.1 XRE family transcriptional regulator [Proteus vulgaris]